MAGHYTPLTLRHGDSKPPKKVIILTGISFVPVAVTGRLVPKSINLLNGLVRSRPPSSTGVCAPYAMAQCALS